MFQTPPWVSTYSGSPRTFNARLDGHVFEAGEWAGWERYLGDGESGFVVHHDVNTNVVVVCSFEATPDGDDPDVDGPIFLSASQLRTREEWSLYNEALDPRE